MLLAPSVFVRVGRDSGEVDATETSSLDIATAIVAGYAALVATLALAFNIFSWLRTWESAPRVGGGSLR